MHGALAPEADYPLQVCEDLDTAAKAQHQVERRLLLDVVVRKRAACAARTAFEAPR